MKSPTRPSQNLNDTVASEYSNLLAYAKSQWREDSERDAEDILQDVVLKLFSRPGLNVPIENAIGYIYRSLKNKIIDLRRKKKIKSLSLDEETETEDGKMIREFAEMEPEDIPISKDERVQWQLMDAIEELKEDQKAIIYATEFEGCTFDELSREWEIPIGTLLARKHRAMAKLQKIMNQKVELNMED
jgi:RNA polymerase sigma factor (sigma-70 family)